MNQSFLKIIGLKTLLFSLFIGFFAACKPDHKTTIKETKQPPAITPSNIRDTAAFFTQLQLAFKTKDTRLLGSLMADTVRSGYLDGAVCNMGGCPQADLLQAAFNDQHAEGWTKFSVVWRMGFGEYSYCDIEGEQYIGPVWPGLDSGGQRQDEKAYIFGNQVHIRETPDKTAKSIGQKSQCWVTVDTDELCYGDAPEDWLPVIDETGKEGYIFLDLTSWSKNNGYIIIQRGADGFLRIIEMNYFNEPPGTWHLPGCC